MNDLERRIAALETELDQAQKAALYAQAECLRAQDACLKAQETERDGLRYRWLRRQSWDRSALCVVSDPKQNVRLGTYCPSGDQLDAAIDAAIDAGIYLQGGNEEKA